MNKKIIGFSAILIMLFSINCNGQSVPQKVKDSFKQKFPSAQSVEWGKESDTEYEAEFKVKSVSYSANFTEDGAWVETEMEIAMRDLPDAVLATLARDYWDSDIEEVARISNAEGTLYEVEIRINEQDEDNESEEHEDNEEDDEDHYETIDLIFNASGKLINKAEMEEED